MSRGAYKDKYGRSVIVGDEVLYTGDGEIYKVIEISNDGYYVTLLGSNDHKFICRAEDTFTVT